MGCWGEGAGMKERQILFAAPMIRSIRAGRKTQTRRTVKPQRHPYGNILSPEQVADEFIGQTEAVRCPYGQPGDRLFVKETFFAYGRWETRFSEKKCRDEWHFIDMTEESGFAYRYAADEKERSTTKERSSVIPGWYKRPAIFMPRRACRIFLDVTAVRVERLKDISPADASAEGIIQQNTTKWFSVPGISGAGTTARAAYALLWNSINGPGSWDANQLVWVVEFKIVSTASYNAHAVESRRKVGHCPQIAGMTIHVETESCNA